MTRWVLTTLLNVVLSTTLSGGETSRIDPVPASGPGETDRSTAVKDPGLPNLVRYESKVLVGGVPEPASAFRTLADMGVKTIVSVDGAIPDVAAAERHGLLYVHLPIGYRGIEPQRRLEIARAVQDGRGRGEVYLHCHHGKHRCASAAATALVSLGLLEPDEGISLMHRSGTSSHYPGLFQVVRESVPVDRVALQSVPTPQAAIERPTGLVESMVAAAESLGRLSEVADAAWRVPAHHPDLQPATEAAAITEAMRLMLELESAESDADAELVVLSRRSAAIAARLERLLATDRPDPDALDAAFTAVAATCVECHRAHRGGYRIGRGGEGGSSPVVQGP